MTARQAERIQRVWLDVTMLERPWAQLTGIERAIPAILEELRNCSIWEIKLCRLDLDAGGFVEVASEFLHCLKPAAEPELELPSAQESVRLKLRVKRLLKPLLKRLPTFVKTLIRRSLQASTGSFRSAIALAQRPFQRLPALPPLLKLGPDDLIICLSDMSDVPERSTHCWDLKQELGFRVVWLIDDLVSILFPQFLEPTHSERVTRWVVDTLWTADLILTSTSVTRSDIRRFCLRAAIPTPPIETIRYGDILELNGPARSPKVLTGGEPFVLCPGPIEARRNPLLLYHVWRKLIEERGDENTPYLVFAGEHGWLVDDALRQAQRDPLTKQHIRIAISPSEAELRWLFQNCLFTVCPSLYEGWSWAASESLAFGKYCVASNCPTNLEIAGDLAGYHDPYSLTECLRQIISALEPEFRQSKEDRIRQNGRKRHWSECARQIAAALTAEFGNDVIKEGNNGIQDSAIGPVSPHPEDLGRSA